MMSRPRRLTGADIEIWLKVVRTVVARPGARAPASPLPAADPPPLLAPPPPRLPPPPKFEPPPIRTPTAASYTPPVSAPASLPLAAFERRFRKKVAGGRVDIEDVLDLHGMTQAVAHGALTMFIARSQAKGHRLVLVVTGKGGSGRRVAEGAAEPGVLRRAVPHWLRDRSLRSVVLGFEEAAAAHGGAGALYVRLRRRGGD